MFRRFDRNSDGKLSLEEIPEFARNRMRPFFVQLGKREITIEDLSRVRSARNDRRPMQRPETGRRPADSDRRPGDRPLPEIRSGAAQRSGAMQRSAGGQPLMNGQSLAFFRELDQNRDGTLSRQELNRAATLLAKFDQNGDDQLEVSELFGLRGPRNSRSGSGPLRPGRRDATDRSGTSDRPGAEQTQRSKTQRSETSRPPASGGNRPDVEQSFKRLDSNSDGFLNRAEVSGKMKEHFVRIDRNADGKVSLEELQATVDRFSRR